MENQIPLNESGRTTPARKASLRRVIKYQTAKIPSTYFLAAAGGAAVLSFGMALMSEKKGWANVVGQWAPTLLLFALYNKVSKTADTNNRREQYSNLH